MKKIFLILLIVHCTLNIENCVCQWFWQNPYPQGNWLGGADAINSSIFHAVGKGATYIRSTDGGVTWNVKHFLNGRSVNFSFVKFANQSTGWICGDSGYILKTTNSGNSWFQQTTNTQLTFTKLFFLNENSGFAIGSGGIVLKTTNGGGNWVNVGIINNSNTFYDVYFINYNTGYICGYNSSGSYGLNLFYKTTNAGTNWISMGVLGDCVYFVNEQTGYASGVYNYNGNVYFHKTTNAGVNWQTAQINFSIFNNLYFINENTGWGNGVNGVWKTTNASTNWIQQNVYSNGTCGGMSYMRFFDSNIFLGVGCSHIVKSVNGGNNWTEVSKVADREIHNQIQFINENTGWTDNFFGMLKSTDAGNNWTYTEIPNAREITTFHFIDNNTGWIRCKYNNKYTVIKTTNGGTNYNAVTLDTNNSIKQIYFINQNTGFLHYDSASLSPRMVKLFRTTNSGINWQMICRINNYEAGNIHFINASTGFAIFKNNNNYYDYYVYKTTNTGVNWFQQGSTLNNFTPMSLLFINENTGWLSGGIYNTNQASIYKTTNGGAGWQNLNLEYLNLYNISKLTFINSQTGFATGAGSSIFLGTVISTTNGGQNWSKTYPGPIDGIQNFYFINSQTGWLCTAEGGIMKTINCGNVFVKNILKEIPKSFCLYQNYPNPFNPATIIRYATPLNPPFDKGGTGGFVTLKVYDILGKEVATLVNEKQTPGVYEITFDGSGFASGIYFYKLAAGNFTETKKMLLIR